MSAAVLPGQLSMFEPVGVELATLAQAHEKKAALMLRAAERLAFRGFPVAAAAFAKMGMVALDDAFTCESAYQLEQLAQLA